MFVAADGVKLLNEPVMKAPKAIVATGSSISAPTT